MAMATFIVCCPTVLECATPLELEVKGKTFKKAISKIAKRLGIDRHSYAAKLWMEGEPIEDRTKAFEAVEYEIEFKHGAIQYLDENLGIDEVDLGTKRGQPLLQHLIKNQSTLVSTTYEQLKPEQEVKYKKTDIYKQFGAPLGKAALAILSRPYAFDENALKAAKDEATTILLAIAYVNHPNLVVSTQERVELVDALATIVKNKPVFAGYVDGSDAKFDQALRYKRKREAQHNPAIHISPQGGSRKRKLGDVPQVQTLTMDEFKTQAAALRGFEALNNHYAAHTTSRVKYTNLIGGERYRGTEVFHATRIIKEFPAYKKYCELIRHDYFHRANQIKADKQSTLTSISDTFHRIIPNILKLAKERLPQQEPPTFETDAAKQIYALEKLIDLINACNDQRGGKKKLLQVHTFVQKHPATTDHARLASDIRKMEFDNKKFTQPIIVSVGEHPSQQLFLLVDNEMLKIRGDGADALELLHASFYTFWIKYEKCVEPFYMLLDYWAGIKDKRRQSIIQLCTAISNAPFRINRESKSETN